MNARDREVSTLCFDEDRILVTNNAVDFLDLAEESGLHPGLVFLPLGSGAEMPTSMATAITAIERLAEEEGIEAAGSMINRVLEVDEDGNCEHFEYPQRGNPPAAAADALKRSRG